MSQYLDAPNQSATLLRAKEIVERIRASGVDIYHPIQVGDPNLWLPANELEALLNHELHGLYLDYPLRTRSKKLKEAMARALGYPVPASFKKTHPRFVGQNFNAHSQQSNNVQPWNEEIEPTRRYVIVRVSPEKLADKVRVISGERLAELDTTKRLTTKFQASFTKQVVPAAALSSTDTATVASIVHSRSVGRKGNVSPVDYPRSGELLTIADLFEQLTPLLGKTFPDRGKQQERNRGGDLHRLVCETLGYQIFAEDGTCPDVKHQLLEVKLQTAPTIDLGLVLPSAMTPLDMPMVNGIQICHRDLRYLLVGAQTDNATVAITHLYLVTGSDFFSHFRQMQGNVQNSKQQIRLPKDFFGS